MLRIKKLKDLSKEDLEKQLVELRKEMMKYRSQISTGTPPENPGKVGNVKKTIARIKTIIKTKPEVKSKKIE